jgi:CBS domain containing-hemolysin-like protein
VVALPYNQRLDDRTIKKISDSGHSRIVVYKKNINEDVGILYVKDLIINKVSGKTIEELARKQVIFVDDDKNLDDLLNAFKKTKNHLFVVLNEFGEVAGIVTIEDVLEEILGVEIVDEFDKHKDLQEVAKRKARRRNIKKV